MEKPSLIVRFFSILLRILVVLVLMVVIAVASFEGVTYYLTGSLYDLREFAGGSNTITNTGSGEVQETKIDETNMRSTLFFVDSADSGKEYMALNMLNTKNYVLDILLIPTNAQVTVGQSILKEIQKEMPEAKNTVNMSDVSRAFGDEKYKMISSIVENVTGLTLSGYDVMTQENFTSFLDMADEVAYKVDDDFSYRDEKGVLQVIKGGQTEVDSEEAAALLTYLDGTETQESSRLERTNVYLQSFFSTLFEENSGSAIYRKYTSLVQSSVDRDRSNEEQIFEQLDPDDITILILQGSESDGVFTVDSQIVQLQISTLAQQAENTTTSSDSKSEKDSSSESDTRTSTASGQDSKDYSIELYNAAYVAGLAAQWEAYLEEEGYTISLVDSYQDEGPLSTTRIVVTEEGMGEDLLTYFPDATIEVDDIDTGGDIQIYIGTDSTDVGGADGSSYSSTEDGDDGEDVTDEDESDSYDDEEDTDSGDEEDTSKEDSGYGGSYNFDTDSAE